MKSRMRCGIGLVLGMLLAVTASAAEFSKTLTPEEFAAAGLSKLTPAELERLDALVLALRSGEVARVREETTKKVREETTVKVRDETTKKVKAEVAATKPEGGSLLNRLKVVLTPGTDIAYATVETELVGSFRGYGPGTVLTLANGQKWRVVEGSYWAPAKDANKLRKVVIEPGALGSFFLKIEDGGRVKVKIVTNQP